MLVSPIIFPPSLGSNAPVFGAFLATPIWTPTILWIVALEVILLAGCCALLLVLNSPPASKVRAEIRTGIRQKTEPFGKLKRVPHHDVGRRKIAW